MDSLLINSNVVVSVVLVLWGIIEGVRYHSWRKFALLFCCALFGMGIIGLDSMGPLCAKNTLDEQIGGGSFDSRVERDRLLYLLHLSPPARCGR